MGTARYRLRDRGARCSGPVTVYRAEVLDRPGQLVRLTCVATVGGSPHLAAAISAWREVRHPALLPVESMEHAGDTLLFRSPGATARPLDMLDTLSVPPATVARIGEEIAGGLAALHLRGRTHGSVGAHTILLGTEGTAVLDGPWHAACLATDLDADDSGAPDGAAQDVRALTATLLDLLDVPGQRAGLALHGSGSRSATAPPPRGTTGPTPAPADVDALLALLRTQEPQPGTARELEQTLRAWRTQVPPASPGPGSTLPAQDRGRGARDPSEGTSAPRPTRPSGRVMGVTTRNRAPSRVDRQPVDAGRAVDTPHKGRPRFLALLVGAVALGTLLALGAHLATTPATSSVAPATASSASTAAASMAPDPIHSTTSIPAPDATGPAPPAVAAASAPAGPRDAAFTPAPRPVCPRSLAPPGRGSLVLADLVGRGCRAPVRIEGDRLSARGLDGGVIEVALGLDLGDQVRVADLDGTGRDEVVVYRPGTGEVFRFAALATPGEAVTVHGRASGRLGGTAVVSSDPSGGDRLEIRGGSPA